MLKHGSRARNDEPVGGPSTELSKGFSQEFFIPQRTAGKWGSERLLGSADSSAEL